MGIVILGAGGHAGVIVDLIEAAMGRNHPGGGFRFWMTAFRPGRNSLSGLGTMGCAVK